MATPDADDPGLLTPAETSLLTDQYELAMAASYFRRGMNEPAVFELSVRHLPPNRRWLMTAGLGPALAMIEQMRFGPGELDYLRSLRFGEPFLEFLAGHRFSGDVDLQLPEDSGFRLDASTVSGDLSSDFDLQGGEQGRRALSGVAGAGDTTLKVETTSGSIHIRH